MSCRGDCSSKGREHGLGPATVDQRMLTHRARGSHRCLSRTLHKLGPLQDVAVVGSIPPGTRHSWPIWPDLLSSCVRTALGTRSLMGTRPGAVIMTQRLEDLLQLLPGASKIIPFLENHLRLQSQSIPRAKVGEVMGKSLWQSLLPPPPSSLGS